MEKHPILIYLAGPIEDVERSAAMAWRLEVAVAWPEIAFFSPATAYLNCNESNIATITMINRAAISLAHGVLANLSGEGRGFGTIREVEYAVLREKPVCVVGNFSDNYSAHDVVVRASLEEGMNELMSIIADRLNQPRSAFVQPLFQMFEERDRPPDEDVDD